MRNRPRDEVVIADVNGFAAAPPMNDFIERFAQAYSEEITAFVEMIETGKKPLADIRDGLEAQRLAEAAIVSMRSGQPVEVDPSWRP